MLSKQKRLLKLKEIKHDNILNELKGIISNHPEIALEAVGHLVQLTSTKKIEKLISAFTEQLNLIKNNSDSNKNSE